MQSRATIIAFLAILLSIGQTAVGANQYGVADRRVVQFETPVRIENTLLPAGSYEVRHTMEGSDHVMVFSRIDAKQPQGPVRAKCTLVPLAAPVARTEVGYRQNDKGELVLVRLQFQGDRAKHMF